MARISTAQKRYSGSSWPPGCNIKRTPHGRRRCHRQGHGPGYPSGRWPLYEPLVRQAGKSPTTPMSLKDQRRSSATWVFIPSSSKKTRPKSSKAIRLMGSRFEQEMCHRVREWMKLAEEKLVPANITLYFMAGNDDLYSIDKVLAEFEHIRNPDMKSLRDGRRLLRRGPLQCEHDALALRPRYRRTRADSQVGHPGRHDPATRADHRHDPCSAYQLGIGYLPGARQEP